jgi:hypothetical protein
VQLPGSNLIISHPHKPNKPKQKPVHKQAPSMPERTSNIRAIFIYGQTTDWKTKNAVLSPM